MSFSGENEPGEFDEELGEFLTGLFGEDPGDNGVHIQMFARRLHTQYFVLCLYQHTMTFKNAAS